MTYRHSVAMMLGAIVGAVTATIVAIALDRDDAAIWAAVGLSIGVAAGYAFALARDDG